MKLAGRTGDPAWDEITRLLNESVTCGRRLVSHFRRGRPTNYYYACLAGNKRDLRHRPQTGALLRILWGFPGAGAVMIDRRLGSLDGGVGSR